MIQAHFEDYKQTDEYKYLHQRRMYLEELITNELNHNQRKLFEDVAFEFGSMDEADADRMYALRYEGLCDDSKKLGSVGMNIIEELYHDNIHSNKKCFSSYSHYTKFMAIISENEAKFTEFLQALLHSEKEPHLLSQMMSAQSEINLFEVGEKFVERFRLGVKFMLDTFVIEQESAMRYII